MKYLNMQKCLGWWLIAWWHLFLTKYMLLFVECVTKRAHTFLTSLTITCAYGEKSYKVANPQIFSFTDAREIGQMERELFRLHGISQLLMPPLFYVIKERHKWLMTKEKKKESSLITKNSEKDYFLFVGMGNHKSMQNINIWSLIHCMIYFKLSGLNLLCDYMTTNKSDLMGLMVVMRTL